MQPPLQIDAAPWKARLQKVNDWGNANSGLLAVVGALGTVLFLMRRRKA